MNSKTTSILAVVCRIGKLIGALFTIIGMLVLIGTLTGLFKPEQSTSSYGYDDYYGYNYGWNSMEFPDGGGISSSREFLSDRSMISWASSYSGSSSSYEQLSALNSITGSLNFMCAGAFVMFFSSIGAFIFDLLSKKNMVGGFIDVCVGLMAFITNFMVTPSTSDLMSIFSWLSAGDYTAIIEYFMGYFAALLLLIMAAFLMFRSAFPCSALTTKKTNGSAPRQPVYQNPVYAQNPYQNQYQNGAQNQYPTGGYNNGNPGGRV